MHAAGAREIECNDDCMQMRAVDSIRARRFYLEKGVTYHRAFVYARELGRVIPITSC